MFVNKLILKNLMAYRIFIIANLMAENCTFKTDTRDVSKMLV